MVFKKFRVIKFRNSYTPKEEGKNFTRDYCYADFLNEESRRLTKNEINNMDNLPYGTRLYRLALCNSQHFSITSSKSIKVGDILFSPGNDRQWSIDPDKFKLPIVEKRLVISGNSLMMFWPG